MYRFFPIFLFFLATACTQNGTSESSTKLEYAQPDEEIVIEPPRTATPPETAMVKTAEQRMEVDALETTTRVVQNTVKAFEGQVAGMQTHTNRYSKETEFTIRVPADAFDQLMQVLEEEAVHIDFTNIRSRDVSPEVVDLDSRLRTKRTIRQRYLDILRTQARTVEDILHAEEKIRVLTEEIEAKEARLRYLQDQIAMSTIHLTIYQKVKYRPTKKQYRKPFADRLSDSFLTGWSWLQTLLLWAVRIWPVWLALGLAWVVRAVWWKR